MNYLRSAMSVATGATVGAMIQAVPVGQHRNSAESDGAPVSSNLRVTRAAGTPAIELHHTIRWQESRASWDDAMIRYELRNRLGSIGEIDESGFGSKSMSCYVPHGDVHVWFDSVRADWRWWVVTVGSDGLPRSSEQRPVDFDSVDEIVRAAAALTS